MGADDYMEVYATENMVRVAGQQVIVRNFG
jgi:hypothetical protein